MRLKTCIEFSIGMVSIDLKVYLMAQGKMITI